MFTYLLTYSYSTLASSQAHDLSAMFSCENRPHLFLSTFLTRNGQLTRVFDATVYIDRQLNAMLYHSAAPDYLRR